MKENMKKLLLLVCMIGCGIPLIAEQTWTPVSHEKAEYDRLMLECSKIVFYFSAMGNNSLRSPALANAIFQYLKNIGTPISLEVLKSQIKAGRVPASYLNNI
jgi:hypothetical protein